MKKEVEFVNNAASAPDLIKVSREASFRNITLKEEFRELNLSFRQGITWLRFLPAIRGSIYDWMMPLDVFHDIAGVTFASPKSFDPNAHSVVDAASMWLRRNHPETLFNRVTNPHGFKPWPRRVGVSWVVENDAPEGERLRLFARSLYDGKRGGATGLAYNLYSEANSRDVEPNSPTTGVLIHGDITSPAEGRLVKIEKVAASKSEYANYKVSIGKNPAPLKHFMALLTEKENNLIQPLENTIYVPSEEEQKEILRRYIGDKLYSEMFGTSVSAGWSPAQNEEDEPTAKTAEPELSLGSDPREPDTGILMVENEDDEPALPAAAPEKAKEVVGSSGPAYTTKEVTALLAREKTGVQELLANRARLSKALLDIVLDSAKEYGLES